VPAADLRCWAAKGEAAMIQKITLGKDGPALGCLGYGGCSPFSSDEEIKNGVGGFALINRRIHGYGNNCLHYASFMDLFIR